MRHHNLARLFVLVATLLAVSFLSFAVWRFASGDEPQRPIEAQHVSPSPSSAEEGVVTVPPTVPATATDSGTALLVYVLIGTLAVAAGAVFVAIRVIYWRKAVGDGQTSIVPDLLLKDLRQQTDALRQAFDIHARQLRAAEDTREMMAAEIAELKEALNVFTQSLNQKDAEIERLRKGGETIVFQKFLNRFLRLHSAFEAEIAEVSARGDSVSELQALCDLLEDALNECGVEKYSPPVGQSLREAFGVADTPKVIETRDPAKHLQIADVLRPGFQIASPSGPVCLRPAAVAVYKLCSTESV